MNNLNDIMSQPLLQVGEWSVDPDSGHLYREGVELKLEPKVMQVLLLLAQNPGKVVSREELEATAWAGMVVGYDAISGSVIKLRKALGDNSRNPQYIETVSKKGYRLIAAVSLSTEEAKSPAGISARKKQIHQQSIPRWAGILGVVLLSSVLLVSLWFSSNKAPAIDSAVTGLLSIVVLPIENLGIDDQHDVFVDGITEDIITDLSRMSSLMVFASNTSFKYKGRSILPQALRDELNVDFVLKGNARRHDDQIRVNVQLVNTETGFNIWAQRYDRKVEEVFTVQDEITASLIDALAIKLSSQEKHHLAQRATNNLVAYEHFLDGQRLSIEQTKQANAQARAAYKQAIEIDPTYGRAYGALAYTLALDYRHGWTSTPLENLERALGLAEQGIALDGSIPQTYWSLGYVYLRRNEYKKAQQAAIDSIRVAPNYADGYGLLALITNGLGQPEQALNYIARGMQLNPYYTWDYLFNVGYAHYLLGNYAQAIETLEKAQARNENVIPIKLILAASYVQADRLNDAEWTTEQIQYLNPSTTLTQTTNAITLTEPRLKKKLLDDLRLAGLPE